METTKFIIHTVCSLENKSGQNSKRFERFAITKKCQGMPVGKYENIVGIIQSMRESEGGIFGRYLGTGVGVCRMGKICKIPKA